MDTTQTAIAAAWKECLELAHSIGEQIGLGENSDATSLELLLAEENYFDLADKIGFPVNRREARRVLDAVTSKTYATVAAQVDREIAQRMRRADAR